MVSIPVLRTIDDWTDHVKDMPRLLGVSKNVVQRVNDFLVGEITARSRL
jgi:hypothetical protein